MLEGADRLTLNALYILWEEHLSGVLLLLIDFIEADPSAYYAALCKGNILQPQINTPISQDGTKERWKNTISVSVRLIYEESSHSISLCGDW